MKSTDRRSITVELNPRNREAELRAAAETRYVTQYGLLDLRDNTEAQQPRSSANNTADRRSIGATRMFSPIVFEYPSSPRRPLSAVYASKSVKHTKVGPLFGIPTTCATSSTTMKPLEYGSPAVYYHATMDNTHLGPSPFQLAIAAAQRTAHQWDPSVRWGADVSHRIAAQQNGRNAAAPSSCDVAMAHDDSGDDNEDFELIALPPTPEKEVITARKAIPNAPSTPLCPHEVPWQFHPVLPVPLSLLLQRGVSIHAHQDLIEYHMHQEFLADLSFMCRGSYLVKFPSSDGAPHNRFARIEMEHVAGGDAAFLFLRHHHGSVGVLDRVPLSHLVGVCPNGNSEAFVRRRASDGTIKGPVSVDSKRLPVSEELCFSLWFVHPATLDAYSIDFAAPDQPVWARWIDGMSGIVAINSISVLPPSQVVKEQYAATPRNESVGYTPQPVDSDAPSGGDVAFGGESRTDYLLRYAMSYAKTQSEAAKS